MIAYFCAEYALDARLKTYAGGLGILAGDTVKEMGDQGIPFIGIGLYYYKGYLAREYDWYTPEGANLQLLKDKAGNIQIITVPIGYRDVQARAWIYQYKTATVYLLDTMLHQNHPSDQQLSYYLYDENINIRIAQEIMLGVGGARLIKKIGIKPHVYHMNEGHSVFMSLEMTDSAPIVFTNHTVIAEGNHMYQQSLVKSMLGRYMTSPQKYSFEELMNLGECGYPEVFSLTHMAMRVAREVNGVSVLHTRKLEEIYPGFHPIAITNGIHIPTWFRSHTHHKIPEVISPRELRKIHDDNKANLLLYLQHTIGIKWEAHSLVLGWARRIIQYKQPLALFADVARLHKILASSAVPVRIIFAGVPHPKDLWANDALRIILTLLTEKFRNQIVYIPNYNPEVAKMLIAGCDVWLNTPKVGLEACGTSGMKAGLNGALQLSTADGWMAEIDISKIGWQLDNKKTSESIYHNLEQHIIPAYSTYLTHQSQSEWLDKMTNAYELIRSRFSTTRMVKDYTEHMWSLKAIPNHKKDHHVDNKVSTTQHQYNQVAPSVYVD